jgi:2-polyprenyl-3-methyl-5-hydroxy-6-metoxy-1,4-benzoquinol methylase
MITPLAAPFVNDKLIEIILKNTGESKSFDVLDIACGKGYNSMVLISKRKNARIDCVDINDRQFLVKDKNVKFRKADLNKGLSTDKKYDFIIATEIIEHLENPHSFMRDCYNHLKIGGYLLMSTPNVDNIYSVLRRIIAGKPLYFSLDEPSGHISPVHLVTIKEILRIIGAKNYKIFYNRNVFPLFLGKWRLSTIPGNNRLFGEINLVVARKN